MRVFARAALPSIAFRHWWTDDAERGIIVQKATFTLDAAGLCQYAEDQVPIATTDTFIAAPNTSSTLTESDLAPHKPRTDILLNATAYAPGAMALPDWAVSVNVVNRLSVSLSVRGPGRWIRGDRTWVMEAPEPVREVPIRYELAYGGRVEDEDGTVTVHEFNPLGRGLFTAAMLAGDAQVEAPQIGHLPQFIESDPARAMNVCGLLPLGRAWLPRRALAGTFDADWRTRRHPRMPRDYAFDYWNAAPAALQTTPYLTGDEVIDLSGLHPARTRIHLPGVTGRFRVKRAGAPAAGAAPMVLDTVMFDIDAPDPAEHRLTLTWRGHFARPAEVEAVETAVVELEDA